MTLAFLLGLLCGAGAMYALCPLIFELWDRGRHWRAAGVWVSAVALGAALSFSLTKALAEVTR